MRKWEPWTTNIGESNNHRMIQQQLAFHERQTIKTTRVQDLDPRPCADNAHESVLTHEMTDIEPTEIPSFPNSLLDTFALLKAHQTVFE